MTAAERLALIRARLQHAKAAPPKPQGLHASAHPDAPRVQLVPVHVHKAGKRGFSISGQFAGKSLGAKRGAWVAEPDTKEVEAFKEPQRHELHYLDKIAEKWKGLKK